MVRTWFLAIVVLTACGGSSGSTGGDGGSVMNDDLFGSCYVPRGTGECAYCVEYTGTVFEMESVIGAYRDQCMAEGYTWSPEACPRAGATLRCTLHEGLETEASNLYYACPLEDEQCEALSGVPHEP